MIRLANIEKAGYFPLPPAVAQLLLTHIAAPAGGRVQGAVAEHLAELHNTCSLAASHTGRQAIARTLAAHHGRVWALDCGNDRDNGQILIGNLSDPARMSYSPLGLVSGLPSPYVQEPDLLEPEPEEMGLSCAALAQREEQSLMVSRLAAAVAAQIVTRSVLQRQVTSPATYFSLEPLVMTSRPIPAAP